MPRRGQSAVEWSAASWDLLAGVGALAIPGVGPIIAGGALASTLAGAGIGAAAGGIIGALAGMGVPEEDARHFERGFQQGGVLVTVAAGGRCRAGPGGAARARGRSRPGSRHLITNHGDV